MAELATIRGRFLALRLLRSILERQPQPLPLINKLKPLGSVAMGLIKWALFFFLFAIVAAVIGYTDLARDAAGVGKVLLVIFLIIAGALVLLGMTVYKKVTD